jgi:hypothetical protein
MHQAWKTMGFPWTPSEMTWVHHMLFMACERRIAELQGHRGTGTVTHVSGSSLFEKVERGMSQG